MGSQREKFLRVFANIPEKVRAEDIIAVVDDKPFTWNAAMIEIRNGTALGRQIIAQLEKLGVV